ncbi:hypothetical protein MtrunA17_Chr2g0295121 [Medicago truncatula]|uniref:Uncharacterized protein n=1 Tax=Medicago truncatula TaxID=3880 RepID=A0A396JA22_MEDTR|nr:hypothetical protein MtrunA17_Chr2g0295121 [Medicago truncatula]
MKNFLALFIRYFNFICLDHYWSYQSSINSNPQCVINRITN